MVDVPEPKSRGRPRKGPNNTRIKDNPEFHNTYHRNYYHSSGLSDKIVCPLCLRTVSKQKLDRHQKTKLCAKYKTIAADLNAAELLQETHVNISNISEMPNDSDDDDGDLAAKAILQKTYLAVV